MKRVVSFLLVLVLFSISSCVLSSGSYPFAETYELDYSEEEVKSAIKKFKNEHPEFNVPLVTINNKGKYSLLDEKVGDPNPHWFKFYFYYKNENQILYTWTRIESKTETIFAFVSINKGLDIGNWELINDSFSRAENKEHLKRFEKCILSKVKYYLENPIK